MKLSHYQEMLLHHLVSTADKSAAAVREAERHAMEDRRVLVLFYALVLQKPAEHLTLGSWPCNKGSVFKSPCVFDITEDPAEDSCLFCGDPEERK
jgi:hypothetical protein